MKDFAKDKNNVLGIAMLVIFVVLAGSFPGCTGSETGGANQEKKGFAQARRLAGRWVRPDGGYTLVLEDIKSDGSLKASYYNPRAINVHEAKWKLGNDGVHLFVELRDVNYPGSKYSLIYIDEEDVLRGTYFQAVHKQTFEIMFVRQK